MMVACHWKEENKRRPSESSVLWNGSNVLNFCAWISGKALSCWKLSFLQYVHHNHNLIDRFPNEVFGDEAHQIRELRRQIDVNWIKTPTDGWGGGGQGILRASRNVRLQRKKLLTSHNFLASLLLSFFLFVEYKWVKNPSSTSSPTCTSLRWKSRAQWRCIYCLRGRVWGEIFGSRWWSIERAPRWPKGQMFSQPALRSHTSAAILVS